MIYTHMTDWLFTYRSGSLRIVGIIRALDEILAMIYSHITDWLYTYSSGSLRIVGIRRTLDDRSLASP
jgi:hypothetical protein